ncbi:MAG: hypothetical protein JW783_15445 [Bacteroidales bacterium]|nr:hypothetical protein [Bacteroidales bacterium]MBN2750373.1 hypothetical protein [Bacteroidales bacterium]
MAKEEKKIGVNSDFSVKEISSLFRRIDEQIIELHKCSSDDFLGLNGDFKSCYRKAKTISDNAKEIFETLTETEHSKLLSELKNLYKDIKSTRNQFAQSIGRCSDNLKGMVGLFDQLFIPVKNLNQDLMTLKFLLANIKVSGSDPSRQVTEEYNAALNLLNGVINTLKISSYQAENNIATLSKGVKEAYDSLSSLQSRNLGEIDTILDQIHYGIILFAEKHEEAIMLIPELTAKTESSSANIAEIITNLQYQDIIRQKMEHIQATHRRIIEGLEAFDAGNDKSEDVAKLYSQIREIAGLQAAQLVFANKEYQSAIEIITQRFQAIGNDMVSISDMCNRISASQENTDELHLVNILTNLENAASVLSSFVGKIQDFSYSVTVIERNNVSACDEIFRFNKNIEDLLSHFQPTSVHFTQLISMSLDKEMAQQQTHSILNGIKKNHAVITSVYNSICDAANSLCSNDEHFRKANGPQSYFTQVVESTNSIMVVLKSKNDRIKFTLSQTLELGQSVAHEVSSAIGKIKYYDFFEKVIVEIIGELNKVYNQLQGTGGDQKSAEELDSIKRLYTMASEHEIHQKVIDSDGDVDLFDDNSSSSKKQQDDIELF